jgi:hypothetical protein
MKASPLKVKIRKVDTDEYVPATIRHAPNNSLPSIQDGWRFNFNKEIRKIKNAIGYTLTVDETPHITEGALIFDLKFEQLAFMSYIEIAPHNKKKPKRFDDVAGCLIAFAFNESLRLCEGDYKALLVFDISEEKWEDQKKLESIYTKNYGAIPFPMGGWCIMDAAGYALRERYLGIKNNNK